jgi:5,10-methylene-tetrahydrofolate dehydrogenase/methenyl tetrahydrofolate cyclohydrolase
MTIAMLLQNCVEGAKRAFKKENVKQNAS